GRGKAVALLPQRGTRMVPRLGSLLRDTDARTGATVGAKALVNAAIHLAPGGEASCATISCRDGNAPGFRDLALTRAWTIFFPMGRSVLTVAVAAIALSVLAVARASTLPGLTE